MYSVELDYRQNEVARMVTTKPTAWLANVSSLKQMKTMYRTEALVPISPIEQCLGF